MEVAVTSECSGQLWNICVWDPLTGTTLRTFKGGISCSKTLNIIGEDYVISSQKDKPILQMWALNRQDQLTLKMIMPGIVQVLAVSPCNSFVVGAASEQLMVWQLSTGKMIASLRRHYQNVSNIQFTVDSSRFVSTGTEGLVLVWSMETVLNSAECEPDFTWSDHSLPVTGLHVTQSMVQPLVFTVSLDQTCKIHELNTGKTLLSIQFNEPMHSVVVDRAEETCYVGSSTGKIYQVNLLDPPRALGEQEVNQTDEGRKFIGHESKPVNCLSVSIDGTQLLSGCDDGSSRLWDVSSGQCVKILSHRGPLTNAFFAPRFKHLETDKFMPKLSVATLDKKLSRGEDLRQLEALVTVHCRPEKKTATSGSTSLGGVGMNDHLRLMTEQQRLRKDAEYLKRVNRQLYTFAIDRIIGSGTKNFGTRSRAASKTNAASKKKVTSKGKAGATTNKTKTKKKKK